MTDDLISKQEALKTAEWVYRACEGNLSYYHDLLVAALMDLTPAKSEWIPCEEQHKKCQGCKFYPWNPNRCNVGLSFSAYAGQCAAYKPTLLTKIKMWLRGLIQNDKW